MVGGLGVGADGGVGGLGFAWMCIIVYLCFLWYVFSVVWIFLMWVSAMSGCQAGCAYVMTGLMYLLFVDL